jgi:predicted MFS family arabinose efflux permease
LIAAPVDLKTWADVGRSRIIVLLLLVTMLQMSGQFVVFTFMGPLLTKLTQAGPDAVGLVFAVYGVFGFIGIAIATRIVDSWGAYKTSILSNGLMLAGVVGWALCAGIYPLMACSVAIWGLGFASTNSMQQVRLVTAAGGGGGACAGVGVAQYFGSLYRAGRRFGDWRDIVRARSALWRRIRRGGFCRAGLGHRHPDRASTGCGAQNMS